MNLIQQTIVKALGGDLLTTVKKQFDKGPESIPIEINDITFRLLKSNFGNINLEMLTMTPIGENKASFMPGLGRGSVQNKVTFFKPICYFTQKKGFLGKKIHITVPFEFEEAFDDIIRKKLINSSLTVSDLSLKDNALLAAFSAEAIGNAKLYRDSGFYANGLFCEIFMTEEGWPQLFLRDDYGLDGPIAAYLLREQNSVNPMWEYKSRFDEFVQMKLFSGFKIV